MICSCDKHLDLVEKSNFLLTLLLTLVFCVFCDDTLIAKEIEQKSDAFELQTNLNNTLEWTNSSQICINRVNHKTKILNGHQPQN